MVEVIKQKCLQCGKPIPEDKIIYGQLYCNEKCKALFRREIDKLRMRKKRYEKTKGNIR